MLSLQRLLDNTPGNHPDYVKLKQAERVMHEFARKIGTANETQIEDSQQETLKKLELLLITDVSFYILSSYSVTDCHVVCNVPIS